MYYAYSSLALSCSSLAASLAQAETKPRRYRHPMGDLYSREEYTALSGTPNLISERIIDALPKMEKSKR